MKNTEPLTWACQCGQMNLLGDRTCFICGETRETAWEETDRERFRQEHLRLAPSGNATGRRLTES